MRISPSANVNVPVTYIQGQDDQQERIAEIKEILDDTDFPDEQKKMMEALMCLNEGLPNDYLSESEKRDASKKGLGYHDEIRGLTDMELRGKVRKIDITQIIEQACEFNLVNVTISSRSGIDKVTTLLTDDQLRVLQVEQVARETKEWKGRRVPASMAGGLVMEDRLRSQDLKKG